MSRSTHNSERKHNQYNIIICFTCIHKIYIFILAQINCTRVVANFIVSIHFGSLNLCTVTKSNKNIFFTVALSSETESVTYPTGIRK